MMNWSKLFVLIVFILMSCGKSVETYTVEMIDGVQYIHNHAPLWGDIPQVKLELIRTFNTEDETDENYQLYKPLDLEVDKDGNIYILDAGNYRVQKLDQNGRFIASFGRRGYGPGEFRDASWLELDGSNNMYIISSSQGLVLDSAGKEIRRIRIGKQTLDSFTILPSGSIALNLINNHEVNSPLFGIFDKDINFLWGIGSKNDYGDGVYAWINNFVTFACDKNENFYVTYVAQNCIEKYTNKGTLVYKTDRPLNYEPGDAAEKLAHARFVSFGIEVDEKNRIWVLTLDDPPNDRIVRREQYSVDSYKGSYNIFNPEGIYLGSIPAPDIIFAGGDSPFKIFGNKLFFIYTDDMVIYEYEIAEK